MSRTTDLCRTYDRWSKVYDQTFSAMFRERQQRAIKEMRLADGDRVLDVGVGTGLTLELYPPRVDIVGLDLSAGMLRAAHRKTVSRPRIALIQGDAMRPPFADESFDHALISHVISVVPDPVALLDSIAQLLRPAGRVVVINHFHSSRRSVAALEKMLNPLCRRLGWRSDLQLADLLDRQNLQFEYQFKMRPMDLWQIVVLKRRERPANDSAMHAASHAFSNAV